MSGGRLRQNQSQIICRNEHKMSICAYDLGMATIERYLDDQLVLGRSYFSREAVQSVLASTPAALSAALTRQIKKGRLANPRQGFYLILRPEDKIAGAPDPARWIDPLMKHLQTDYRISLLRAAAFHGASHQAAMVFQVIVPKQMRGFEIGRHRLEFVYQIPTDFGNVNQGDWLDSMKSDAGFAKVASIELTLLDCARYFHKSGGINGLAQIVKDLGGRAKPARLAKAAVHYENSSVRRLGYLLERMEHLRQAKALQSFVRLTKTAVLLDPSVKPLIAGIDAFREKASKWMLIINEAVEIDS
jgi:predicted transcriptional regulator of viral defense system